MRKGIALLLTFIVFTINAHSYNFLNILSTDNHTIFLNDSGIIFSVGSNLYGQLGIGYSSDYEKFSKIECKAYFVSIAVGENHNLALDSDGFIWGWGSNEYLQLSCDLKHDEKNILNIYTSPIKLNNEKWVKIYACGNLSFGIYNKPQI